MEAGVDDMHQVREWLQYVPQFSGKVFALDLPWSSLTDIEKAELMMDISRLQHLSIKMLLSVDPGSSADFTNWAIDFDLKLAKQLPETQEEALQVLKRGQAALIEHSGETCLEASFIEFVESIRPSKVIALLSGDQATRFSEAKSQSLAQWQDGQYAKEPFFLKVSNLLKSGVSRVHFLDASEPGVLLRELFSSEGAGLMVYNNDYRIIRKIESEDIPDLLTLIGRSVRNSKLVPRLYEGIESQLDDYYLYEIDGNVVGCVALHTYDGNWAEVACLYVKQGHEGRGYGEDLVKHVESVAKATGRETIFALTLGAKEFFETKLSYQEIDVSAIPQCRYQQLQDSGRDSKAFMKRIEGIF